MTEEQEQQLRAMLAIEGFDQATINATILNTRYDPEQDEKWVRNIAMWMAGEMKSQGARQ